MQIRRPATLSRTGAPTHQGRRLALALLIGAILVAMPGVGASVVHADQDAAPVTETQPVAEPTPAPTPERTPEPTPEPTARPTKEPKPAKAKAPVADPTAEPTPEPTAEPTAEPTPEAEPTAVPTPEPTLEPTADQTPEPTLEPTAEPTSEPTAEPTPVPTPEPSPSSDPTSEPSPEPPASPTPSASPEASPGPELSPDPSPSPDASIPPEASAAPELSPDPSATPDPAGSPAPAASPDPSALPELAPEPSVSPLPSASPALPTVRTDLLDYAPGSAVLVQGEGWQPDEPVTLDINDDIGRSWRLHETVLADASGAFTFQFWLPERFIATYTIDATGPASGHATWRFDDSIGTGPLTTGTNGTASEITVATPPTPAGRLLLATIVVEDLASSDVICTPSGWTSAGRTSVSGSLAVQTFYRVSTGSEAASYTWRFRTLSILCLFASLGGVTEGAVGGITAYAGVDTTSPIASISGSTGSGSSILAPSVAGAPANATVVRAYGNDRSSTITPAASSSGGIAYTTAWSRVRSPGSLAPAGASADADHPSGGSTGTLSASNSGGGGTWAAQTIVLNMVDDEPVVELTIGDPSAVMGSNLRPSGTASNSSDSVTVLVDGSPTSAGACYRWPGSVTVEANAGYDLKVTAAAANNRLDLLSSNPATYAACTGGEPVGPSMFPSASPAGAWVTNQTATAGRMHSFWLGLDVRWTDPPSASRGNATLTFSVMVDW